MSKTKVGSIAQQAAKKKLQEMQRKGSSEGSNSKYIKLEAGDKKVIRVAAPWTGDPEDPFYLEGVQHFGLGPDGKTTGNCPGRDKCPACKKVWNDREGIIKKAAQELKAQGKPHDQKAAVKHAMNAFKKQWAQAGRIGGKTRYTVNAVEIDHKTKELGTDTWATFSFGPQIMTQMLTFFNDEIEWGVFYVEDTAYDFIVERIGDGMDTEYKVTTTRKCVDVDTSGLGDPQDLSANKYYTPHTPEEIQQLMEGETLEEEIEEDDEEEAPKKVNVKLPAKKTVVEDDEEEAPKKVNVKLPAKKTVVEDDEDEDEEVEVEEEEEEVAPPPKKAKKSSLEDELKAVAKGKKKK